jgi:uncharacterized coiled-coil protein SlyX
MRYLAAASVFLICSALVAAADDPPTPKQQEPPVRLKKKLKPGEPEKKPEPSPAKIEPERKPEKPPSKEDKDAKEPSHSLQEEIEENMRLLTKELREADERIGKKDAGAGTQQVMDDIVKNLDALIEKLKDQQASQQSSSASSRQRWQQRRNRQRQEEQTANGRQQREAESNQQASQQNPGARGGGAKPGESSRLADIYKDIWGHLPETLRQEMNQYSREQFMAKYGDLLKQYYATIAEKGRRKGDAKE